MSDAVDLLQLTCSAYGDFWHDRLWGFPLACSPHSRLRQAYNGLTSPLPSRPSFVANHLQTMDMCENPEWQYLHGKRSWSARATARMFVDGRCIQASLLGRVSGRKYSVRSSRSPRRRCMPTFSSLRWSSSLIMSRGTPNGRTSRTTKPYGGSIKERHCAHRQERVLTGICRRGTTTGVWFDRSTWWQRRR